MYRLRPSTKFEVRRFSRSEDTAHLVCQLSIYNSFPVIRITIAKKSWFLRTQAFIFCLPWGCPCGNHAKRCMNEKTIQCLPYHSQHIPIYVKQFPSYSNRKCKKSQFSRTAAHIFVSPGDAPAIISNMLHGWKDSSMLVKPLAHVPIYLQQFPSYSNRKCKKIAVFTYRSPHFCFPWRRPCNCHPICSMDGKTIQCLPTLRRQNILVYSERTLCTECFLKIYIS